VPGKEKIMRDRKAERKSSPGIHNRFQKHPTVETAGEPGKIHLDRQGHLLQKNQMHPEEITSLQRTVGNRAVLQTAPDDEKTFPADPYSLIPAGESWDHDKDKVGSVATDIEKTFFPSDPYSLIPAGEEWNHDKDKVGAAVTDDENTFPAAPDSLIPAGEAWDHENDKVGSAVNDMEGGSQEDGELDVPATGGANFSGLDEELEG